MNAKSARRLGYERGDRLSKTCQEEVKKKFTNRYTKEHKPKWALEKLNGNERKPQFESDDEWLRWTWFKVNNWGFFDPRSEGFHSRPTWPDGKE